MDIRKILDQNILNLAEDLDEELLDKIGQELVRGYTSDLDSRSLWDDQNKEWMKLALQIKEEKSYPWPKAANIKYPLLTTAALQFSARAYPSLVPSFDIVKAKPLGMATKQALAPAPQSSPMAPGQPGMGGQAPGEPSQPPMGGQPPAAPGQMPGPPPQPEGPDLQDIADKISTHMSYQVLYEMQDWEEEMDKLCLVLPILGCAFKKTYYSTLKEKNCSELVLPKDLIVNYWAKSLESASRKTHRLWFTPNEIIERQRTGLWREYDGIEFGPGSSVPDDYREKENIHKITIPDTDSDTPRQILEVHTSWDLDEDDYKEPYVITIDFETEKVLRITPRFRSKDVMFHPKDPKKIAKITPREYFTKFSFIPNPDGSFYDLGFGLLLGSLNQAANTILNLLTDAGSLSNLQSGFLAKGLRLGKAGDYKFEPGEWKPVNNTMEDLKKGIYPLPVREPSNVLFQLLGMLVQSGKEMASIAEIFTGKMPGQNTPASTTMATIEQGLKVFTSIYKRMFRSLGKEFEKLFELNTLYLPDGQNDYAYEQDGVMIDASINSQFYQDAKVKIVPAADPNMVTETQKLMQLQSMMEMMQYGQLSATEVTRRGLEIHGIPGISKLMEVPPPPEPIEITLLKMEQADKDKDRQIDMMKVQSESRKRESEITLNIAKAKQLGDEEGAMMLEHQLEQEKATAEIQTKWMDLMFQREKHQMDMKQKQDEHQMDMQVKSTEASMNMATQSAMNEQNITHNQQKNEQQLKMMKDKKNAKGPDNQRGSA